MVNGRSGRPWVARVVYDDICRRRWVRMSSERVAAMGNYPGNSITIASDDNIINYYYYYYYLFIFFIAAYKGGA